MKILFTGLKFVVPLYGTEYAYHSLGGKSERHHSLCRLSFEYPAQHFEQDQRPEKDMDTAAHSNKEGQI